MAKTITVSSGGISGNTSCLEISDGNVELSIYKSRCTVSTDDNNNVIISWDATHYYKAPASMFLSPSGTAVQVQAAIATMLLIS
jgi:hypothetical protein